MHRIKTLVLLVVLMASMFVPQSVSALNRVQDLTGMNPQATFEGMKQRDLRIGIGTFWWQVICGSNPSCPGGFTNLTILPVLGLNVAVGPSFGNTVGAVYQLLPEETTPFGGYPSGVGTFLAADATQVMLQGLASTNTASIGPLSPPGTSGLSIDYLIECDVKTVDTTNQPISVVSTSGNITGTTANRDRNDIIACQSKAGVPATTGSQVAPSADSGFVAIGYVAVPFGTTTINNGMIFGYPPLSGYVSLSPPSAQSGTINISGSITSGSIIATNAVFSGTVADSGETAAGDITTYRQSAPTTGYVFFGNTGLQSISFDGSNFNVSAPIIAPSIVANSHVSPSGTNLILGAGSGTNGVLVNYNTGATSGLTIYNGATGLGPLAASSGGFSGALSATSLVSSGSVSGTSGSFSGPVSGTSGTFTGGLYSTNGALYLNSGSQYLDFDGTKFIMTAALSVPGVTSSGAISGTTGTFSGGVNSAGLTVPGVNGALTLGLSGNGNGFVNAAGTDALYLNFGSGTNGIQFCNGATTCLANVTPTGGFNGAGFSTGGTVTGATFVDTSGTIYLNAADTQYLQFGSPGYIYASSQLSAPGLVIPALNGAITLGQANAGGGFVNAAGSDPLYLNFGTGSGGIQFCAGNSTCHANISSAGALTTTTGNFTGAVSVAGNITANGSIMAGSASATGQIYDSSQSVIDYGLCNLASFSLMASACSGYRDLYANNFHGLGIYAGTGVFTGGVSAAVYATTSDRRLKKGIRHIAHGLNTLMRLYPKSYQLRSNNKPENGFIAQEVEGVVPEAVITSGNRLSLNYDQLIAIAVESIKEQQIEISALKRDIAALKRGVGR